MFVICLSYLSGLIYHFLLYLSVFVLPLLSFLIYLNCLIHVICLVHLFLAT